MSGDVPLHCRLLGSLDRMSKSFLDRLLIGGFVVALCSCAAVPKRPPPTEAAYALWRERTVTLLSIPDWSFNGRVAASGQDLSGRAIPSSTLRVHWSQHGASYAIAFMSLLGERVAEIDGGPAGISLRVPDEAPMQAPDSQALLASVFGWSAPLEGIRYWIMGLPRPFTEEPRDVSLDDQGHLLGLDQDGWHVDISHYSPAEQVDLPRRVTLTQQSPPARYRAPAAARPGLRIKLSIDEWMIRPANHASE
jgi:outer membrane lipoprotein LolB